MSKAKAKGTSFESDGVAYINSRLGKDVVHRIALAGKHDKGDIYGLKMRGKDVAIEAKNHRSYSISEWLDEAEIERGNADAEFGVVLFHLRGKGKKHFGENAIVMTLDTFLGMTAGSMELLEDLED